MPVPLRRPVRYGMAIAADRIVAVSDGDQPREVWAQDLLSPRASGEWPELIESLEQFCAFVGGAPAVVSIALLPSLAQMRSIELPFMRKSELLPVLQRDAARYFYGVRDEQVVAIRHLHRSRGRRAVLAAAAPRWLIELLVARLPRGSLRLEQIIPAYSAWAFAADSIRALSRPAQGWLAVHCGEVLELLELRRGTVRRVRRLRPRDDEALVRQITSSPPDALASVTKHESAMNVAARNAGRTRSLALVAPSLAEAELCRGRRQARWLLAAAAILMAVSSLLRIVDVKRELAHVRAARNGMELEVSRALSVRSTVSGIAELLALLCGIRENAPSWSDAIVTVATHLPLDTHVMRLSSAGDSLMLEGSTQHASVALDGLRGAPGVIGLHASAPIRMEANPGEDPTEYFTVVLRVDPAAERVRK